MTALTAGTLFRFATAGSVDDGKSTLVGRLLHDSKAILSDQLEQIAHVSQKRGFAHADGIDFALLTDGLRAEREQGITIDVAYRYFATARRSFILADCPGHVQYTRNMVTGATTADAVVVLIDGRKGVLEQTRRHLAVTALLRVPHVIVAVNKIDLLDYDERSYRDVEAQVRAVASDLGLPEVHVLPVSALEGHNVVERSARTPWYEGPALVELLETLPSRDDLEREDEPLRLSVQLVLRPQGGLSPELVATDPGAVERLRDYRAAAGRISSGTLRVGARVQVLPSGLSTTVTSVTLGGATAAEATAPQSVAVQLADDIDLARGSTIVGEGTAPTLSKDIDAQLFLLDERALSPGDRVLIKHGTSTVQGIVDEIRERRDLDTLALVPADRLQVNEIGRARIRLAEALPLEPYRVSRHSGSFLVIRPSDGHTIAAGTVDG